MGDPVGKGQIIGQHAARAIGRVGEYPRRLFALPEAFHVFAITVAARRIGKNDGAVLENGQVIGEDQCRELARLIDHCPSAFIKTDQAAKRIGNVQGAVRREGKAQRPPARMGHFLPAAFGRARHDAAIGKPGIEPSVRAGFEILCPVQPFFGQHRLHRIGKQRLQRGIGRGRVKIARIERTRPEQQQYGKPEQAKENRHKPDNPRHHRPL